MAGRDRRASPGAGVAAKARGWGNFPRQRAYGGGHEPNKGESKMKTFAQLSALGVAAVLLLKLLGVIVVPLLGFMAAAFAFALKFLLIAGAAWLVWTLIRKSGCCGTRDEE